MKHSNISIFVPHIGCPHRCSFCDQNTISGAESIPHGSDVREICSKALAEVKSPENAEIAFFGGSFTAIPEKYMTELLEAAYEFVGEGKFRGIRVSTRPDCINRQVLGILKRYGVTAIELGAQSMDDEVLAANERGHTAGDVEEASHLIKEYGFELGLQMMIGLYKSTVMSEEMTYGRIAKLHPDTLRIYPVVILKGTRLGELYESGEFVPFSFDEAVELCSVFMERAAHNGIRVIKAGLHASEFVEENMLGGFYHPAFRELCEGRIYLRMFRNILKEYTYAKVSVPARRLSQAMGHKKCNISYFSDKGKELVILPCEGQEESIRIIERR